MTTAIILAGGSGIRVGMGIPKQFVEISGKPILVYTLERFEAHPRVDEIVIVCVKGWEKVIRGYIEYYHFMKVKQIVPGGSTAIHSIKNGFKCINGNPTDIVLIHEGVRPLVEAKMISDIIDKCQTHGAAMSATPLKEHIFYQEDSDLVTGYYPREQSYKSSSPHAYTLEILAKAFKLAEKKGDNYHTAYSSTMMIDVGIPIAISYGSDTNIKITTKKDIALFKALLEIKTDEEG